MNFSFKCLHLLTVSILLLWFFESTIGAKEILKCNLKSGQCNSEDIYAKQRHRTASIATAAPTLEVTQLIYTQPDQRSSLTEELVFSPFWPRHNKTTTLKPKTTTEIHTKSTTHHSNLTTEQWNTTTTTLKSSTYHSNSTTKPWSITTASPKLTTYPSNSTTEQWNTTTTTPKSSTYHSNSTTEQWNTTTTAPKSTTYNSNGTSVVTRHHHFRRKTTIKQ